MTVSRRKFVLGVAATGTAMLTVPATGTAASAQPVALAGARGVDWAAVRAAYRLNPKITNLGLFYLASNPEPVRAAIDRYSAVIDADPLAVNTPPPGTNAEAALAGFIGGSASDIALTQNTTIGLGLVYNGLVVTAGQEILLTEYEHFVHRDAARLAAAKNGATLRETRLYADPATATVDEITAKLKAAITPKTRAVGTTWVQSSVGVRMPIAAMAAVVAEANRGRAAADRCLLIVDGVHGLCAVDADAAKLGGDVFVAGTHKWLGGPRGTGMVWINPAVKDHVKPFAASFSANPMTPGGFVAYEHRWAVPAAVTFMNGIGRGNIGARVTELSTRFKEGLAGIPGVSLKTPRSAELSAGITCFEKAGVSHQAMVERLRAKGIYITTASYKVGYPRVGTGIPNTPAEIDAAVAAVRAA